MGTFSFLLLLIKKGAKNEAPILTSLQKKSKILQEPQPPNIQVTPASPGPAWKGATREGPSTTLGTGHGGCGGVSAGHPGKSKHHGDCRRRRAQRYPPAREPGPRKTGFETVCGRRPLSTASLTALSVTWGQPRSENRAVENSRNERFPGVKARAVRDSVGRESSPCPGSLRCAHLRPTVPWLSARPSRHRGARLPVALILPNAGPKSASVERS